MQVQHDKDALNGMPRNGRRQQESQSGVGAHDQHASSEVIGRAKKVWGDSPSLASARGLRAIRLQTVENGGRDTR